MSLAARTTRMSATGAIGTESQLRVSLNASDLSEIDAVAHALSGEQRNIPAIVHGQASFNGTLTGKLISPAISGRLEATDFDTALRAFSMLNTSMGLPWYSSCAACASKEPCGAPLAPGSGSHAADAPARAWPRRRSGSARDSARAIDMKGWMARPPRTRRQRVALTVAIVALLCLALLAAGVGYTNYRVNRFAQTAFRDEATPPQTQYGAVTPTTTPLPPTPTPTELPVATAASAPPATATPAYTPTPTPLPYGKSGGNQDSR